MDDHIERVKTSLQIDENIDLHIRGWIFQRIGWALMLLFLTCAALGLFGNGALSRKVLADDGTSVTFEKYTRRESETEFEIVTRSNAEIVRLVLPPAFLHAFKIEKVVPEPSSQRVDNGATVLQFTGSGEAQITLFVSSRTAGSVQSTLRVDEKSFDIDQFIYP